MGALVSWIEGYGGPKHVGTVVGTSSRDGTFKVLDKQDQVHYLPGSKLQVIDAVAMLPDDTGAVVDTVGEAVPDKNYFRNGLVKQVQAQNSNPDWGHDPITPEQEAEFESLWNGGQPDRENVAAWLFKNRVTRYEDWPPMWESEKDTYLKRADQLLDPDGAAKEAQQLQDFYAQMERDKVAADQARISARKKDDQDRAAARAAREQAEAAGKAAYANPPNSGSPIPNTDTEGNQVKVGDMVQFKDGIFGGTSKVLRADENGNPVLINVLGDERTLTPSGTFTLKKPDKPVDPADKQIADSLRQSARNAGAYNDGYDQHASGLESALNESARLVEREGATPETVAELRVRADKASHANDFASYDSHQPFDIGAASGYSEAADEIEKRMKV